MSNLCAMCNTIPVIVDKSRLYAEFCTACEKRVLNRLEKKGLLRKLRKKAKG